MDVRVGSMAEQFDLELAARVKGEACASGCLVGLFCEHDLVPKAGDAKKETRLNPEVYQEAAEARAMANGLLQGDSCKDGGTICVLGLVGFELTALLQTHQKKKVCMSGQSFTQHFTQHGFSMYLHLRCYLIGD